MRVTRDIEIRRNYDYFKSIVGTLMSDHSGEVALIHDQNVVAFYPTAIDAVQAGSKRFGDVPFSIQEVVDHPIDLGFLSHASDNGITA